MSILNALEVAQHAFTDEGVMIKGLTLAADEFDRLAEEVRIVRDLGQRLEMNPIYMKVNDIPIFREACEHDWEVTKMDPHDNPFHIGDSHFQRCRKCGEEGTF